MKRKNYLFNMLLLLFVTSQLGACRKEVPDIEKVQEQLELKALPAAISLDENQPAADIVTFTWKAARQLPAEYTVSYTTKLDAVGGNFGSSTAIVNQEDDRVWSRSFSSEQLQHWAVEKWGLRAGKPFTVEFRVVAQWSGGPVFQAPEVRTVSVNVQPVRTVAFDADKVFLGGTALPGMSTLEMGKTPENQNQYAALLDLQAGELQIPVQTDGATNYLIPADLNSSLKDGEAITVKMQQSPFSWKIETPGKYRVVANMQKGTCTLYSPARALQPKSVVWNDSNGVPVTTTVTALWMHGAVNSWGTPVKMDCSVSLADPQVLVYTGGKTGKTKFIVYGGADNNKNIAYTFSCPPAAQEQTLTIGKTAALAEGTAADLRNSYYTIPAGANTIVFDLRNRTIIADKK